MENADNIKKIKTKAAELGVTPEEIEGRIPQVIKLAGLINPKIIGGHVKRMTAEINPQEVLAKQVADDFASKGDQYAPIIAKAIENPAVFSILNQALGTGLNQQSLGYDSATRSLDAGKFSGAVLDLHNIPSEERFVEVVTYLQSQLNLVGQVAEDAAASSFDASAASQG